MREIFITLSREEFDKLNKLYPEVGAEIVLTLKPNWYSRSIKVRFQQPGVIREIVEGDKLALMAMIGQLR